MQTENKMLSQAIPLQLTLDFEQVVHIVLQMSLEQRQLMSKILENHLSEPPKLGALRGTWDISQYRKPENANKDWDCIEGKWPGDETDEEIYKALEELS